VSLSGAHVDMRFHSLICRFEDYVNHFFSVSGNLSPVLTPNVHKSIFHVIADSRVVYEFLNKSLSLG
jgi:hypothetical protein